MSKTHRDIIERLRDPMIAVDFGDRLMAADEIERLCAELKIEVVVTRKVIAEAGAAERAAIL
jgi:hypothetical protein